MIAGHSAAENRPDGFDCNSPTHAVLFYEARHAAERAAGSGADDDGIDVSAHLVDNFATGSFVVIFRICLIFELQGQSRDCGIFAASSRARRMAPAIPSSSGVRITSAPRACMIITFSFENFWGTQTMTR